MPDADTARRPVGAGSCWGTLRNYQTRPAYNGLIDIDGIFVPDDGSRARYVTMSGVKPDPGIGEYARGHFDGETLEIKVGADAMVGGSAAFRLTTLGDLESARDLVERATKAGDGFVDILINNAGVALLGPSNAATEAAFDETFALNAKCRSSS